jgi:uncharacterized protein
MKRVSRRRFISDSAKGALAISAAGMGASCSLFGDNYVIPRRTLGKTGLKVSILSFGGGSHFMKNETGEWEKLMEEAIHNGVNLFDTSPGYRARKGLSGDERFGTILPKYRDKVLLSTKLDTRNPRRVKNEIQGSLSRLKTDYIDILLLHALGGFRDDNSVNLMEFEKGIYRELIELKKAGIARFIGFSSMDSAQISKKVLDNFDVDVALLAMNATRYGDYAKLALPSANKQDTGVIAMKVMLNLVGKDATAQELLEYTWGHEGVASALIAHHGMEPLTENIQLAQNYKGSFFSGVNRRDLEARMANYAGPHALPWARPGYTDGEYIV